jgi:hypothetical protein
LPSKAIDCKQRLRKIIADIYLELIKVFEIKWRDYFCSICD